MNAAFVKNMLRENQGLFRLVHEYNMFPSGYIHESRSAPLEDCEMLSDLRDHRRFKKVFSKQILEHYQLSQRFCYDFEKMSRRIFLLDGACIERLKVFLGVTVHCASIARVILREEKSRLMRLLGEYEYNFALKRAPLIAHSSVLAATGPVDLEDIQNVVVTSGKEIIERSISGEDAALTGRFSLKFPEDYHWNYSVDASTEEQALSTRMIGKILAQEFTAQWKRISP